MNNEEQKETITKRDSQRTQRIIKERRKRGANGRRF